MSVQKIKEDIQTSIYEVPYQHYEVTNNIVINYLLEQTDGRNDGSCSESQQKMGSMFFIDYSSYGTTIGTIIPYEVD